MVVAPFMLARAMNALDHDSDGLICWNVVTGSNDGGAQNYGRDKQYPPNERYDTADEVVEVANGLWNSWEEDALVLDLEKGIFADGSKVHPINHDGPYFRSRGPLSSPRPPQGSPGICQAGGSGQGKAFASRWAETVIAVANGFFSRRYVTGICDGLVPELHKRGGTRTQYEFTTFRENLMAF
jgi:alkanesulfonate monooxygenase SsuD/methylene tetrahydromethanopterin reductase-like flavin-dependent oxidoreductase (luciferase family)